MNVVVTINRTVKYYGSLCTTSEQITQWMDSSEENHSHGLIVHHFIRPSVEMTKGRETNLRGSWVEETNILYVTKQSQPF